MAFGWAKVAVSITIPAVSTVASPPSSAVKGHAETRREQGDHLAGRGRVRIDPVGRRLGLVGKVVVDDYRGSAANSAAWRWRIAPTRSSEPQSTTTSRS